MALQGKILNPLICFDTIFSKEMGLIKMIQSTCVENKLFDLKSIQNKSDREILSLLQSRDNPNPLSIFQFNGDIDEIYEDMTDHYYETILNESPFTDFGYPVIAYVSSMFDNIDPYILVSSEMEEDKVRGIKELKNANIIINDSVDVTCFGSVDPYYINSYTDLYSDNLQDIFYDKMIGKNIYLSNVPYNYEFIKAGEYGKLSNKNEFTLINIWRKDKYQNDGK